MAMKKHVLKHAASNRLKQAARRDRKKATTKSTSDVKLSLAETTEHETLNITKDRDLNGSSEDTFAASDTSEKLEDVNTSLAQTTEQVKLRIVAGRDLHESSEDIENVLVSVETPADGKRQPCDITCIIDTSGSMSTEATIQDANGNTESHGLSLLDVAKHGVRTIINTLGEHDRLCLVSFNQYATTCLPLSSMDSDGRALAQTKLDQLTAGGGTDIWAGLLHGLDALRSTTRDGRLAHVMLLTDGQSQSRDSIMPRLEQYQTEHGRLPGTISTFGFGYGIDSDLLIKLATTGSGSYSFIPDAGFVGTVFVNTVSNLLVTIAQEAYLYLKPNLGSGAEIVGIQDRISGGHLVAQHDEQIKVNLGTLQSGQSKDIIVPMKIQSTSASFLTATLQYQHEPAVGHGTVPVPSVSLEAFPENVTSDVQLVETHLCRVNFAEALSGVIAKAAANRLEDATAELHKCIKQAEVSPASETINVKALLEDMFGQCAEALSRQDWFSKWGRHYIPSLMFAHRLQQCNNFKDPGVQCYGGNTFTEIRDEADDVFNSLPPPKPSVVRYNRGAARSAPVSMSAYNNCFGG